jgi:hypothetical protein
MQATCRAAKAALNYVTNVETGNLRGPSHLFLWARPKTLPNVLLTLKPHRYTHITQDTRALIAKYIDASPFNTVNIRGFQKDWPGAPARRDITGLEPDMDRTIDTPTPRWDISPKDAMWKAIAADYMPSNKPSYSACTPPQGNSPAPAILAAIAAKSRLIFSTVARLATAHCFDAPYSERFRPTAGDTLTCPCDTLEGLTPDAVFTFPREGPLTPNPIITVTLPPGSPADVHPTASPVMPRLTCHTKEHVIFACPLTQPFRNIHLQGITSLHEAFQTVTSTERLCLFLKSSQCSILRPLPKPVPRPDPP